MPCGVARVLLVLVWIGFVLLYARLAFRVLSQLSAV
jgi:hypothetical protein